MATLEKNKGIDIKFGSNGKLEQVVFSINKMTVKQRELFIEYLEDLEDIITVESRKNDETISFDEVNSYFDKKFNSNMNV